MTLTLFTSVASVLNDMVQRSDLIARASRAPDGVADNMSVESLEARQATERALVNEGRAAIEADIAVLRARLAETKVEHKARDGAPAARRRPVPAAGIGCRRAVGAARAATGLATASSVGASWRGRTTRFARNRRAARCRPNPSAGHPPPPRPTRRPRAAPRGRRRRTGCAAATARGPASRGAGRARRGRAGRRRAVPARGGSARSPVRWTRGASIAAASGRPSSMSRTSTPSSAERIRSLPPVPSAVREPSGLLHQRGRHHRSHARAGRQGGAVGRTQVLLAEHVVQGHAPPGHDGARSRAVRRGHRGEPAVGVDDRDVRRPRRHLARPAAGRSVASARASATIAHGTGPPGRTPSVSQSRQGATTIDPPTDGGGFVQTVLPARSIASGSRSVGR